MKSYKHLVSYALDLGHTISVWDGEEWPVSNSTNKELIIDAIESVEEAQIRIKQDGKEIGWALIIPFGLEDDETVADFTMTEFMLAWDELYTGKRLEL
jgi:hypothetical protein